MAIAWAKKLPRIEKLINISLVGRYLSAGNSERNCEKKHAYLHENTYYTNLNCTFSLAAGGETKFLRS